MMAEWTKRLRLSFDFSESKKSSLIILSGIYLIGLKKGQRHFRQSIHKDKPVLEHALDTAVDICTEKCATTDSMLDRQGSSSANILPGKPRYCRKKKIKPKTENSEKSCRVWSQNPHQIIQRCKTPKILKRCKTCKKFVKVCRWKAEFAQHGQGRCQQHY